MSPSHVIRHKFKNLVVFIMKCNEVLIRTKLAIEIGVQNLVVKRKVDMCMCRHPNSFIKNTAVLMTTRRRRGVISAKITLHSAV